jgi:Glycosyl hydrolases family 31/Domain of unknown function (DUF4968)
MKQHLRWPTSPQSDVANQVIGDRYRISVFKTGLLRLEYSERGQFEDRASQTVVNRSFGPTKFCVTDVGDTLEIETERLRLTYDKLPFSAHGLSAQVKGPFSRWHYGARVSNLGGTARTLDGVDGAVALDDGVLSVDGLAIVDDSNTALLTEDGLTAARIPGNLDIYVFAFGRDYRQALKAFYELTGAQPLLPRYTLGNWWSRYHPYTAEEYLQVMDRFRTEQIPLSAAVLDIDWHPVHIDPKYGSGWTGYSWNTELFPDPPAFLDELHRRGLATALNVHPAEGIRANEDAYPRVAARLGIDPASERPIEFDLTDEAFLDAYLEELHHTQEAAGVDFWWLDWQQGGTSRVSGMDPLWLLNHFHYLDSKRNGSRALTFSRYAGIGSHRYPIGFCGDTVISWASLDFQPYFTATASNIGFGCWSHDVGGHFLGHKDDELATRWVQLGVFSPITRLHSSLDRFNSKEPWRFSGQAEAVMTRFLRLRHRLVPYLYTMNVRAHLVGEPLIQPMYYEHPWEPEAYQQRNQFMFGTELLVAPITTPIDRPTGLAQVRAWLPPGDWIDFFTGQIYRGPGPLYLHRELETLPVLARAGAIIPLTSSADVGNGVANPDELEIRIYAGADGDFVLVEDRDDDERWARTRFTYSAATGEIVFHPVDGDRSSVPALRNYRVVLCGFSRIDAAEVLVAEASSTATLSDGPAPASTQLSLSAVPSHARVRIHLLGDLSLAGNDVRGRLFELLDRANIAFTQKNAIFDLLEGDRAEPAVLPALLSLDLEPQLLAAVSEQLFASGTS